jgi:Ca2+-binding RTX toxin-like protein
LADITISASTTAENATGEIATLTCESAVSYRLIADEAVLDVFEVVGDKIVVKEGAVLDYEIQSTYHFGIEALDAEGNPVGSLTFTEENPFTVLNLNDNKPDNIRLDGQISLDIPESTQAGTFIGTLSAADADGDEIVDYEFAEENSFFEIVDDNGIFKVQLKVGVDYESATQHEHTLKIIATDSGGRSSEQDIVINVANVNDNAPDTIRLDDEISVELAESATSQSIVGLLSATDADGDLITGYSLEAPSDFFQIDQVDGKWVIRLKAGVDYETVSQRQHVLQVRATDGVNESLPQDITVNIININDNAPEEIRLSNTVISEGAKAGDIIGELSAIDPDGDLINGYSLVQANDFFEIAQVSGKWVVRLKAGVDYETASQQKHTLRVTANDGVHTSEIDSIEITVTNENDNAPSEIRMGGKLSADVSEGIAVGSDIGVLSAMDADGNPITGYELVGGNTSFEIVEVEGRWVLRLKAGLDYEGSPQHVLKIRATDGINVSDAQDITINVTNVNDNAPTGIVLSNTSLSESTKVGDVVGILSATDADGDPITGYSLFEENAFFALVNENGTWQIKLKAGVDYETVSQRVHVLKITATDGVRTSAVQEITINVVNANEAPTDIVMTGGTIGDNAILGATVATLAGQDPDRGDQLTYTIVEDETGANVYDHPYFGISGNEIVVASDLVDAPIGVNLPVYVKVTDAKGLFYVKKITLTVDHVNVAPEVTADSVEVLDGSKGGTLVAVISAEDADDEALTYKLSEASAQWFALIDNGDSTWNVVVKQGITLRSDRTAFQSLVVEVSDTAGNTTKETVFLNINENQEPEATFEFLDVEKNTPGGTLVGTLVGYDPEGQSISYTLTGESAGLFTLVKNASGTYNVFVKQGVTLDYNDEAQHSFTVTATDGFNSYEESFDLVFGNFAPRLTAAPPITVKEGDGGNIVVASFKVNDSDEDIVDCILSSESAAVFDLVEDGNGNYDVVVREGIKLDYENLSHHMVRITVSDGSNTFTRDFTVNLTDEVDVITGTARVDSLNGTAGRDIIKGLAGNDSLVGNTGDDTLYGGAGKDVLTGGAGQDAFVFDSKPNKKTNLDKIADFKVVDDSIWLENKIFTKLGKKGTETKPAQLSKKLFALEKAKDKDDYVIYSKKTGKLYYDADGSGSKAAVEIATLSKKLAMTYKDFFVI